MSSGAQAARAKVPAPRTARRKGGRAPAASRAASSCSPILIFFSSWFVGFPCFFLPPSERRKKKNRAARGSTVIRAPCTFLRHASGFLLQVRFEHETLYHPANALSLRGESAWSPVSEAGVDGENCSRHCLSLSFLPLPFSRVFFTLLRLTAGKRTLYSRSAVLTEDSGLQKKGPLLTNFSNSFFKSQRKTGARRHRSPPPRSSCSVFLLSSPFQPRPSTRTRPTERTQ